ARARGRKLARWSAGSSTRDPTRLLPRRPNPYTSLALPSAVSPSMELLHDQLLYKRAVLEQLLIVATIFGAFSVSGVIALLVAPARGRLRTYIFLALCVASLAFIFATALDAILLPGMHRDPSAQTQRELRGLLDLGEAP